MTIEEQHAMVGRLLLELSGAKAEYVRIVDERARNLQTMLYVAARIAEIEETLRAAGVEL